MILDHIEEFTWVSSPDKHSLNDNIIISARGNNNINNDSTTKAPQPRQLPSFIKQLFLLTVRAFKQQVRDVRSAGILFGLTFFSSLLIGLLYRNSAFIGPPAVETIAKCPQDLQFLCAQNQSDTYMVQGISFMNLFYNKNSIIIFVFLNLIYFIGLLICLSLGLTACASSLFTFGGTEKLVFGRECTTGILFNLFFDFLIIIKIGQNNLAYFMAKSIACLPNMLLAPLLFMSVFQWLTTPDVPFWKLYIIALGIVMVFLHNQMLNKYFY